VPDRSPSTISSDRAAEYASSVLSGTSGEFLVAFVLYADTFLSINRIAPLLDHAYNTVYDGIRRMEAAFERASRPSGTSSATRSTVRHRSPRPSRCVRLQGAGSAAGGAVPRRITGGWSYPVVG
jgi:hypothetical protein